MKVRNAEVQVFGSYNEPSGMVADVVCEDGAVIIEAHRSWDDPQWYLYDVAFALDRFGERADTNSESGIGNIENKYPIPLDSKVGKMLADTAQRLGSRYVPA